MTHIPSLFGGWAANEKHQKEKANNGKQEKCSSSLFAPLTVCRCLLLAARCMLPAACCSHHRARNSRPLCICPRPQPIGHQPNPSTLLLYLLTSSAYHLPIFPLPSDSDILRHVLRHVRRLSDLPLLTSTSSSDNLLRQPAKRGKSDNFNTTHHQKTHEPPPTLSEGTLVLHAHRLLETLTSFAHGLLAFTIRAAFSLERTAVQPSSHAAATSVLGKGRSSPAHAHFRAGVLLLVMMLFGSASAKDARSHVLKTSPISANETDAARGNAKEDASQPTFGWNEKRAEQSQSQAHAEAPELSQEPDELLASIQRARYAQLEYAPARHEHAPAARAVHAHAQYSAVHAHAPDTRNSQQQGRGLHFQGWFHHHHHPHIPSPWSPPPDAPPPPPSPAPPPPPPSQPPRPPGCGIDCDFDNDGVCDEYGAQPQMNARGACADDLPARGWPAMICLSALLCYCLSTSLCER